MESTMTPDFRIHDHGSVVTIEAVSNDAIALARHSFDVPDWAGVPECFTTDHRPARELIEDLVGDGWKIEGTFS
jgi:hypothetical protein